MKSRLARACHNAMNTALKNEDSGDVLSAALLSCPASEEADANDEVAAFVSNELQILR